MEIGRGGMALSGRRKRKEQRREFDFNPLQNPAHATLLEFGLTWNRAKH